MGTGYSFPCKQKGRQRHPSKQKPVRQKGFEPLRLSAHAPKACASAIPPLTHARYTRTNYTPAFLPPASRKRPNVLTFKRLHRLLPADHRGVLAARLRKLRSEVEVLYAAHVVGQVWVYPRRLRELAVWYPIQLKWLITIQRRQRHHVAAEHPAQVIHRQREQHAIVTLRVADHASRQQVPAGRRVLAGDIRHLHGVVHERLRVDVEHELLPFV